MSDDFIGFIVTKNGCPVGITRPKGAPKLGVLCGTLNFVVFGDRRTAKRAIARTRKFLASGGAPLIVGGDKYRVQSLFRYVKKGKGVPSSHQPNKRKKGRVPRSIYAGEELPFG